MKKEVRKYIKFLQEDQKKLERDTIQRGKTVKDFLPKQQVASGSDLLQFFWSNLLSWILKFFNRRPYIYQIFAIISEETKN